LKRESLWQYQAWWIQDRRDWKIKTQGKEQVEDVMPTELVQALSVIILERRRLTKMMISDKAVSEQKRKQTIADLYSFITRDYTVLYLPGEEPVNGTCPIKCYGRGMER
jgi:hypothetical protein